MTILTPDQLAAELQVSKYQVGEWFRKGVIPGLQAEPGKKGSKVRFVLEEVLDALRIGPSPATTLQHKVEGQLRRIS